MAQAGPNASLQQTLFPELDAVPKSRNRRRGKRTLLDAMLLAVPR
jgi:hypothetical protein